MLWVLATSIRRNLGRYALSLVAVASAVAVSCLGMSGVTLMMKVARQPITQLIGGDLMVIDSDITFYSPSAGTLLSTGTYELLSPDEVRSAVSKALPGSQTTANLAVPCHSPDARLGDTFQNLVGRLDLTGSDFYSPPAVNGTSTVADTTSEMKVFVPSPEHGVSWGTPGQSVRLVCGRIRETNDGSLGIDIAQGTIANLVISGVYSADMTARWLFAPLATVQSLTGAAGLETWTGVCLQDLSWESHAADVLSRSLADGGLGLQVISAQFVGELLISDFARLKDTASLYFPVTVLLSGFITSVTCLTLMTSRRRELALFRAIGQSRRQLAAQFAAETSIISLLGGLLGYLLAHGLALIFFRSAGSITMVPVLAAFLVAALVSSLMTRSREFARLTEVLRNQ